jgi:hypothetical protein
VVAELVEVVAEDCADRDDGKDAVNDV